MMKMTAVTVADVRVDGLITKIGSMHGSGKGEAERSQRRRPFWSLLFLPLPSAMLQRREKSRLFSSLFETSKMTCYDLLIVVTTDHCWQTKTISRTYTSCTWYKTDGINQLVVVLSCGKICLQITLVDYLQPYRFPSTVRVCPPLLSGLCWQQHVGQQKTPPKS